MNATQFPALSPAPAQAASVVAVVLNWSAEELTSECIASLECSQYSRLRILLLDNGSPARPAQGLTKPEEISFADWPRAAAVVQGMVER